MARYTWTDFDHLALNDPLKLRDVAYELMKESDESRRLLFKMIQTVEQGRTAVNEVMYHAERLFDGTT